MVDAAQPALLVDGLEMPGGTVQTCTRLVEASLLARDLGQRRLAGAPCPVIAKLLRKRQRLSADFLCTLPIADELEHLGKLEQDVDARALLHERRQSLEVGDRGGIRVR